MITLRAQLRSFIREAPTSSHMVLIYGDPEEMREVVFTFIKDGLEKGEAAIYLSGDEGPEQASRELEDFGLDVNDDKMLRVTDSEDWYVRRGTIDKDRVTEKWMKALRDALHDGYKGLRVTGEPTYFFRSGSVDSWMDYERSLPRRFEFPITAICRYKLSDLRFYEDGQLLPELIRIHSHTITPRFAKEIDYRSFFVDSVNRILNKILGETTRQLILSYLEMRHSLPRGEIPYKADEFKQYLSSIVGIGAKLVEEEILSDLYKKVGLKYIGEINYREIKATC